MIHNNIMSSNSLEPLIGKALLEKLQTLSNLPHRDRAKQCGYYTTVLMNDGRQKIRLNLSEFYDAILVARAKEKQSQPQQNTSDRLSIPNNPNQPREFDAVLGNQSMPPFQGVVLGGIEGVKSRLNSSSPEARIVALREALNYGEAGLDLAIAALKDSSRLVQGSAYQLLRERKEKKVKQALSKCDPSLFFTTLHNWNIEDFNPQVGITDPFSTAYVVDFERLELLCRSNRASQITALVWRMPSYDYVRNREYSYVVDALFDVCEYFTNLKALCIGDIGVSLGDLSALLKAYPQLELLQFNASRNINFSPTCHYQLKTLIIQTVSITQICHLELPALEYLDLRVDTESSNNKFEINLLSPILSGKVFPNLKHLGLRNSKDCDKIAYALVKSLIVHRLLSLDLSDGNLGDKGAEALINCSQINRLHTLNLSRNRISKKILQRLSYLRCQVVTKSQTSHYYHRYNSVWE